MTAPRPSYMQLVLSLFPGVDLLGLAFKREGFAVVQGGDVIFGGDIRDEHYPSGKFEGVIGGPPCQAFSRLAHMVRYNGFEPKFGNLIPEFERIVSEAEPAWFVMENVPDAPVPAVQGYDVYSYILNNRQCLDDDGLPANQNRVRRFSWGWLGTGRPPLHIDICMWESASFEYAAIGGTNSGPRTVRSGKNGKRNTTMPFNSKSAAAFVEIKRRQGFPETFDLPAFTVEAKCKAVANGVPIPMGRAIAKAVAEATGPRT